MAKKIAASAASPKTRAVSRAALQQRAAPRAALQRRAAKIRCVIFDVDGVITDGKLYLGPDGQEWKVVSVRDGLGLRLLLEAGVEVAVISGRPSIAMQSRLNSLGIKHVYLNTVDKLPTYARVLRDLELHDEHCAVMGDDTPDLPLMKRAGLALTVADAHGDVLQAADWVSRYPGGQGAVREACDLILAARSPSARGAVTEPLVRE
jgi:3-deoxy-D-manno-octulosonate 8-phosphate phosphatase (KDO 8-P phosphatase)